MNFPTLYALIKASIQAKIANKRGYVRRPIAHGDPYAGIDL